MGPVSQRPPRPEPQALVRGVAHVRHLRTGRACVGHIWVNVRGSDAWIGSVGYWLLPDGRGRGLATRALRLVSRWAFQELGITLLRLYAEPSNERSQRVAERGGFRRIGVVRRPSEAHGRATDHVMCELTPDRGQAALHHAG